MTAAPSTPYASFTQDAHLEDAYVVAFQTAFDELIHLHQFDMARRLVSGWVKRLEEGHDAAARLTPHVKRAQYALELCA